MTVALDLFAGTGWGVACQRLGIVEYGVEVMSEARAVRKANGMNTMYADVWDGLLGDVRPRLLTEEERAERLRVMAKPVEEWDWYDLLIASPPCQTFSMAGSGKGRQALDEVLATIDERLYLDPEALRAFGEKHDPKTALVLTPLAHIARDTPLYVVLEQVPPVLPVWERYAEEMRRWGYSVWTGNLQAEQYGVPQTRKRAILIARADGREAKAPTPTHSRYYPRDAKRLDEGILPWVSMADALGWGMTERPMVTAGNAVGRAEGIGGSGGKAAVVREKERGAWIGNQVPGGATDYQRRDTELPAPTVTSGARSAKLHRGDAEQVRTGMGKGMIERHGDRKGRDVLDPAFTVLGGDGGNCQDPELGRPGVYNTPTGRPAPTVTAGGTETGGAEVFGRHGRAIVDRIAEEWHEERPATTVAGDSRVWPPGHKVNADDERRLGDEARERYGDRAGTKASRVTVAEAAALQSYPRVLRLGCRVRRPEDRPPQADLED